MSTNVGTNPILDHIVILVSHTTLLDLPTRLRDTFTIFEGGTHAHGLTSNYLVLLEDGVYLEFIAFVDGISDEKRREHPWGQSPENTIVDWAYTLASGDTFAPIRERLQSALGEDSPEFSYGELQPGGRQRPDGEVLKWEVIRAKKLGEPLIARLPFWCLDQTPRRLRVPYVDNPRTKHPSGARGISRVQLSVPHDDVPGLQRAYNAIHDTTDHESSWTFSAPSGHVSDTQKVHLQGSGNKTHLELTFLGGEASPESVEILPGVVVHFDK